MREPADDPSSELGPRSWISSTGEPSGKRLGANSPLLDELDPVAVREARAANSCTLDELDSVAVWIGDMVECDEFLKADRRKEFHPLLRLLQKLIPSVSVVQLVDGCGTDRERDRERPIRDD